jgi:hypothetical protein
MASVHFFPLPPAIFRHPFSNRVHLHQERVLFLRFIHAGQRRHIHATVLGAPFEEAGPSHDGFPTEFRSRYTSPGILENAEYLTVGKARLFLRACCSL